MTIGVTGLIYRGIAYTLFLVGEWYVCNRVIFKLSKNKCIERG